MRIFIGIPIVENIKERMYENYIKHLSIKGLKPVTKNNLHITLKFIGEVSKEEIEKISTVLKNISFDTFDTETGDIDAFPSMKQPRVIFIKLVKSQDKIKELFSLIEKRLFKIKINKEKRTFHPHITIARVKKHANTSIPRFTIPAFSLYIDRFVLYESILKPQGPEYYPKKTIFLEEKNGTH